MLRLLSRMTSLLAAFNADFQFRLLRCYLVEEKSGPAIDTLEDVWRVLYPSMLTSIPATSNHPLRDYMRLGNDRRRINVRFLIAHNDWSIDVCEQRSSRVTRRDTCSTSCYRASLRRTTPICSRRLPTTASAPFRISFSNQWYITVVAFLASLLIERSCRYVCVIE